MPGAISLWIIFGAACLAAEKRFGGFGLLFFGLGALGAGALVNFGLVAGNAVMSQLLAFLILTGLFGSWLWKPLQEFRGDPRNDA